MSRGVGSENDAARGENGKYGGNRMVRGRSESVLNFFPRSHRGTVRESQSLRELVFLEMGLKRRCVVQKGRTSGRSQHVPCGKRKNEKGWCLNHIMGDTNTGPWRNSYRHTRSLKDGGGYTLSRNKYRFYSRFVDSLCCQRGTQTFIEALHSFCPPNTAEACAGRESLLRGLQLCPQDIDGMAN